MDPGQCWELQFWNIIFGNFPTCIQSIINWKKKHMFFIDHENKHGWCYEKCEKCQNLKEVLFTGKSCFSIQEGRVIWHTKIPQEHIQK